MNHYLQPNYRQNVSMVNDIPQSMVVSNDSLNAIRSLFFDMEHTRESLVALEDYVESLPDSLGKDPFPLFHDFSDGMYRREMHAPKGWLIIGRIHKKEYFVNVTKGKLWVVSEFGAKEVVAPASFKAKAGVKHVGFTLEDTVWSDTSRCEATTVDSAEDELFCDTYEELDEYSKIVRVI